MALQREELVTYLSKKSRSDLSKIDDTTELFSSGLIDSFAMVDLLMWIEKQTGARVDPSDISVDNFDTIERILAFTEARKKG